MSDKIKFKTNDGTWIYGEDVEDPDDILVDPSEYYDWLFASESDEVGLGVEPDDIEPDDIEPDDIDPDDIIDILTDLI
jgi:hypothetical protein